MSLAIRLYLINQRKSDNVYLILKTYEFERIGHPSPPHLFVHQLSNCDDFFVAQTEFDGEFCITPRYRSLGRIKNESAYICRDIIIIRLNHVSLFMWLTPSQL